MEMAMENAKQRGAGEPQDYVERLSQKKPEDFIKSKACSQKSTELAQSRIPVSHRIKDNATKEASEEDAIDENVCTPLEDTPPSEFSRAPLGKSLSIEEETKGDSNFIVFEHVEDDNVSEEEDNQSEHVVESTEDLEVPGSEDTKNENPKADSEDSPAQPARSRSPTIEELKALSRRNWMIKSMESVYDSSPAPQESIDISNESESQKSCNLNTSRVSINSLEGASSAVPAKNQHTALKQKSKTSHFLKSHRKISPVKQSIKLTQADVCPSSTQMFEKPREALLKTFDELESTNWEIVMTGLNHLVRLLRNHADHIDMQMHMVCIKIARSVRNLRSQIARTACQAADELFTLKTRYLEQECDDMICALLARTADTNRFIRGDATRALESMCDHLLPTKVLNILANKGAAHQNALVRTSAAKLLTRLVERVGSEKIYSMPRDQRDRLFITGVRLLQEGSLETRNHAKSMFRFLVGHPNFHRVVKDIIPLRTYRNVEKTLRSLR